MARVYVSSTIADLKTERQAVIDWLVAARHQPVHSYRPSSDTVRDSCLDDVDSCDLYVLMLGHRYGFVPEEGNPEGMSITHLEFRRAGQAGVPRIALLHASTPGASLAGREGPQQAAAVSAFRAEVTREIRAAEFSDLHSLIQQLSTGVQAELNKLSPEGPVLSLAPRPPFLAGREDLLADLDARLGGADGREPRAVVLHGLAGAGKTSVALAYAHDHLGEAGVVWQFAAEDPAVLAAGFGELAAALGAGEGTGDPVVAVHGALAARRTGWLLIFDNTPSQGSVRDFLPVAGNGRVLITSQSAVWPRGQAVEVPVLDAEIAAVFLVDRTGDPDSQTSAALAKELGGLPLALEQAAAYIETTGITLAGYLPLFQDRWADLLARGEAAGHPETVAATLGLALSRLEAEAPAAAGVLRLLGCLAPEPVPLTLLLSDMEIAGKFDPGVAAVLGPLLDDPVAAGDAVTALRHYSLVTPAGDGMVLVHRLVQAFTLDQVPADQRRQWQQAAATLVEAAIPTDPRLPAAWPACAVLLPHARAILDPTSGAMWRIANYLSFSGSYLAARELWQLIADAHQEDDAYGPEHPDTLAAYSNLATYTGLAGDAAGARDRYAALLTIRERVSGPAHPETLTARANLAHMTGQAGDAAGARDRYAALLPIVERVSGPTHPATLTIRANLARWTGEAGDAAGARDQFAALLPIRERVSGPEHPDTLSDRVNFARWTGEAGDAAEARGQFAALLPIVERVSGPEHPVTLTVRANLARWTGEAGDAAGARDQFAALLPVRERVSGPAHPDTLTTRRNHEYWTEKAAGGQDGAAGEPSNRK